MRFECPRCGEVFRGDPEACRPMLDKLGPPRCSCGTKMGEVLVDRTSLADAQRIRNARVICIIAITVNAIDDLAHGRLAMAQFRMNIAGWLARKTMADYKAVLP